MTDRLAERLARAAADKAKGWTYLHPQTVGEYVEDAVRAFQAEAVRKIRDREPVVGVPKEWGVLPSDDVDILVDIIRETWRQAREDFADAIAAL
jgi:hypothetical protein